MDDRKLMAEFMGLDYYACEVPHSERDPNDWACDCYKRYDEHPIINKNIPDYPNDMTELLGVMDELGEHGDYDPTEYFDDARRAIFDKSLKCINLPQTLYPLLIEAIKKIKE